MSGKNAWSLSAAADLALEAHGSTVMRGDAVWMAFEPMHMRVRADLNLTHPADLNLARGWVPAL